MILSLNGIISGKGGIVFDVDAQAFITNASITNTTQKTAINQLVLDLKSANIWGKMKTIYPFVGGTASSHRFNLKDPRTVAAAFYLNFYGGGTHSANGYQPDGATAFADTRFVPSIEFSGLQDNSGVTYYNATPNTSSGDGCYSTGSLFLFRADTLSIDIRMNVNFDQPYTQIYSSSGIGTFTVTKNGSTTVNSYHNGVLAGSTSKTSALVPKEAYIGARNQNGIAGSYNSDEKRFIAFHTGLSSAEVLALKNAIQTYQTTLGRQV